MPPRRPHLGCARAHALDNQSQRHLRAPHAGLPRDRADARAMVGPCGGIEPTREVGDSIRDRNGALGCTGQSEGARAGAHLLGHFGGAVRGAGVPTTRNLLFSYPLALEATPFVTVNAVAATATNSDRGR